MIESNKNQYKQALRKKLSIDLIQLPKLRHKSTHLAKKQNRSPLKMRTSCQRFTCHNQLKAQYLLPRQKHHKSLTRVQQSISKNRKQFQQRTNMNESMINETFLKMNFHKKQLQKSKKLQKRKVFNMQKQIREKSTNSQFAIQNIKKEDIYTGPMIILDYKIQMSQLNHCCFEGGFPLARVGATLSYQDDNIYLFGGCPDSLNDDLVFHKQNVRQNTWKPIKSTGQKPFLSLIYHTANTYKDFLIFSGGMSLEKFEIKKFNNPHIYLYNCLNSSWSQYNWGTYLKHHSSCMINNTLIIHGGINQRERTENKLHFVHLNLNNIHFSKVISFNSNEYLSHHKMITTICQDSRLRGKFKIDGILMFGGKKQGVQKMSNELYYLQVSSFKLNDDDNTIVKKWSIADIKGPKPQPRMCHSFDILPNKGLAVLIGGINEKNQYLNDMWIFDLFGLSWTKVQQIPCLLQTQGIAYHSTTVDQSQIYLYGGISMNKNSKQFYLIQTQKFKRQYSKHQSRKRVDISSNMISFKAFQ